MTTTTFKGTEYEIIAEYPVTPLLAKEGITKQEAIKGPKGVSYFLQTLASGIRRRISTTGRVLTEYPTLTA